MAKTDMVGIDFILLMDPVTEIQRP